VDRNLHAMVISGSVGAALGLVGGLAASLVVDRIYRVLGGAEHGIVRQYLAAFVSWAVLGSIFGDCAGSGGEESQAAAHRAGGRRDWWRGGRVVLDL